LEKNKKEGKRQAARYFLAVISSLVKTQGTKIASKSLNFLLIAVFSTFSLLQQTNRLKTSHLNEKVCLFPGPPT